MADPFSVVAGTLSIADICIRTGTYLRAVKRITKNADKEIESLESEINNFSSVYSALGQICVLNAAQQQQPARGPSGLADPGRALWSRAADLVKERRSASSNRQRVFTQISKDRQRAEGNQTFV